MSKLTKKQKAIVNLAIIIVECILIFQYQKMAWYMLEGFILACFLLAVLVNVNLLKIRAKDIVFKWKK